MTEKNDIVWSNVNIKDLTPEVRIAARIREKDHTLWSPSPTEISNRLGWLNTPFEMQRYVAAIDQMVTDVKRDGYTRALLLGMGGSSLAPEVYRRVFGVREGFLDLSVLDSIDPTAVLTCSETMDPAKTLFIVSTKSGGTIETFSLMKYFFNRVSEQLGAGEAGRHFMAVTDPGSALEKLAAVHRFRKTFLNDPDIGGRYSALSFFGLAPAALCGVDVARLLRRAADAVRLEPSPGGALSGLYLGTVLGEMARSGRDKLTFVFPERLASFGDWLEQLIAESTGKDGRGILPVVGEPLGTPEDYGHDRFFVSYRLAGEESEDKRLDALARSGQPILKISLADIYDLGGQIFLWEMATAVAGHLLGVNPFDQPDVERSKILARQMLARYLDNGVLPVETPAVKGDSVSVYGDITAKSPDDALNQFLNSARPGAYIALQAFLPPSGSLNADLLRLRTQLLDRCRLATTVGYGPRFLHSTGQLHKGDGNRGLFIQLTADDPRDVPIPDAMGKAGSSMSFGTLKAAQALGDRRALRDAGRQVVRFHLGNDIAGGLRMLADAI